LRTGANALAREKGAFEKSSYRKLLKTVSDAVLTANFKEKKKIEIVKQ